MESYFIVSVILLILCVFRLALTSYNISIKNSVIENLENENENLKDSLQKHIQENLANETEYMQERNKSLDNFNVVLYYLVHTVLKNEKAREALAQWDEEEFKKIWRIAYDRMKETADTKLEQELREISGDASGYNFYGLKTPDFKDFNDDERDEETSSENLNDCPEEDAVDGPDTINPLKSEDVKTPDENESDSENKEE